MARLEFCGSSSRDADHAQGNTSRLINYYREPMGGMATYSLKPVPGTKEFATMGGDMPTIFVRDIKEIGGRMYVMAGGTLYDVRADGSQNAVAETVSKSGAKIFGAEDGKVATITDGRYFVWDGTTLVEPTGGNFTGFGSGVNIDGFTVLSQKDGRQFLWSDLRDAGTLPALNFAVAESTDDNIQRVVSLSDRLWVMKESVIELWSGGNGSGADFFQPIPGGVISVGLLAPDLVAEFDGGIMFIGSDGIAYVSGGGAPQPISTPAVNTAIDEESPTQCFAYESQGHKFAVVRFENRPAWVFDISTQEWHERATRKSNPWNITTAGKAYGKWFGGTVFGKVVEFGRFNADATESLIRTAVSNTIYNEGRRFRGRRLEITGRTGEGEAGATEEVWTLYFADGREFDIGHDPVTIPDDAVWRVKHVPVREPSAHIRFSGDGGKTWSLPVSCDMGSSGEFDQRMIVRNFGAFRRLTVEVSTAAPKDTPLDCAMNLDVA